MAAALVYFLFFCSGISGLVYQVVWVRGCATVFGNTIYSSAIVVAIQIYRRRVNDVQRHALIGGTRARQQAA